MPRESLRSIKDKTGNIITDGNLVLYTHCLHCIIITTHGKIQEKGSSYDNMYRNIRPNPYIFSFRGLLTKFPINMSKKRDFVQTILAIPIRIGVEKILSAFLLFMPLMFHR